MNSHSDLVLETGVVIEAPLNRLKASPRNARKVPHGAAAIEALEASIAAKGVLQAPVVEPERDGEGRETGFYLVTIGEGRRLALRLLAQRKRIKKTALVRCVLDIVNDAHEISLDENVTRTDMHPGDQFEAFRDLAERRGLGAEEIGARFGVSAHVVRQRLRLGAVSPVLMGVYRDGGLTLDQLMAFAVSEDHQRQEQVFEQLSFNRSSHAIRRAMTEEKIAADDRRAVFVGAEAYEAAGGAILRDLFTEDGGGWFEDVALVEHLCAAKLADLASDLRDREGWKWGEAHIDYPHAHGLRRVYPRPVERTPEQEAGMAALSEEYDALVTQWAGVEDLPPQIEARFREIDAALEAYGDGRAYDPADVARGGLFVVLGHDGQARIERGFIRPEDEPAPEPVDVDGEGLPEPVSEGAADEEEQDGGLGPLSERLVLDLTAHRTLGLRDTLAAQPTLALTALVHALAVRTFYPVHERASCLEIRTVSVCLDTHAPGLADSEAGRRVAERHEAWAARLPKAAEDAWAVVAALDGGGLLDLLACCVSQTVNALHNPLDRHGGARRHADALAQAAGLDMTAYWAPTARGYLDRVTKARIAEAVCEGVSPEAAERISPLKKGEMAQAAEQLLAGTRWLPALLRTTAPSQHADERARTVLAAK